MTGGQALDFQRGRRGGEAGLMSSGRRLFLTFNLSGQVGNTCDSCLYCTAHIWGWENKTNCKQTETLTFFIIQCLFQTLVLFCKQLPPRRTDRHLIIKSTASSFSTLLLLCFDLMEFPSFWFFLKLFFSFPAKKKKKKGLTCSINNKKEFFFPSCLLSCVVLCWNVCVWRMNTYVFNPGNCTPF